MSHPPSVIHVSRLGWCALAVALLAPWAIMAGLIQAERNPSPPERPPPVAAAAGARSAATTPPATRGPWGEFLATRIMIEPPEEFIPVAFNDLSTRWVFAGYTPEKLESLWADAGVDAAQRARLRELAAGQEGRPEVTLTPDRDLVVSLTPAARARIYGMLAQFPQNEAQRDPFRFRAEFLDSWFQGSDVDPQVVALTHQLLYPRGKSLHFADAPLVLASIPPAQRARYVKTLARKSALLLKLVVRPDTDVEAVARYWGRGRRAKDLRPLLQSLQRIPGGGAIDIAHLMPGFARSLLYTYPMPTIDAQSAAHDCHWTSFNFFNETPDERFADIDVVKRTLLEEYYQVMGEPEMGDIVMILRADGVVVHSCVYLADSIVFTKNGSSFSVPWTLARQEDVVAFYSLDDQPSEVRRYRAKRR